MRPDDLRSHLQDLAQEAPETDVPTRLAGVDARVRARHRRTVVASVAGVATLVVLAVFALPQLWHGAVGPAQPAHDPTPTTGRHDEQRAATVLDHGVRFFSAPAGNPLIGHGVGKEGQSDVTFSFTPTTSDVLDTVVCTAPQTSLGSGRLNVVNLSVNGEYVAHFSCGDSASSPQGADRTWIRTSAADNELRWKQRGLVAGQPSTVRVWLTHSGRADAPVASVPGAQVGAAFWAHAVTATSLDVAEVDTSVEVSGVDFDLFDAGCQPVHDGRATARVGLGRLSGPALVVKAGYRLKGTAVGFAVGDQPSPDEVGILAADELRDPPAAVRASVRGLSADRGFVCVAVYTPRR